MSRYARWQRSEYPESTRMAVTLLAGPVFLGLLPFLVAGMGPRLDRGLRLPALRIGAAVRSLGGMLSLTGFALGLWSVRAQLDQGRGTPLAMLPTQTLVTDGPFRYCRNPMTLGAILAYVGIAIAARTSSGIALVVVFAASLLTYLKRLEEGELAERFGDAYLAYRQQTPFILPRLARRH
jgi:protein-S-isoprenylcysteine O-methyltransferase Ste14